MTKHIIETWNWDGRPAAMVRDAQGHDVAHVSLRNRTPEDIASIARLIAAAPRLIAAAEVVMEIWDDLYSGQADHEEEAAWQALRKAIALARGGTAACTLAEACEAVVAGRYRGMTGASCAREDEK